jgi:vacuolar-type H+-ATPase subunit F/Vma7
MALCAFLGDEVSAAGFRLAGVEVHQPTAATAIDLFQRLRGEVELLLLTAEVADWLPEEGLRRALAAGRPLVLVIPDIRGRFQPPDISARLRRQLGMAE